MIIHSVLTFVLILSLLTVFESRSHKMFTYPSLEMVVTTFLISLVPVMNYLALFIIFVMGLAQIMRGEL